MHSLLIFTRAGTIQPQIVSGGAAVQSSLQSAHAPAPSSDAPAMPQGKLFPLTGGRPGRNLEAVLSRQPPREGGGRIRPPPTIPPATGGGCGQVAAH